MNLPPNATLLQGKDGKNEFVILPYDEFLLLSSLSKKQSKSNTNESNIPKGVVDLVFDKGYTAVRAWREYLNMSQEEIAEKLGISQPAFSKQENSDKLRKTTKIAIAKAMELDISQLDF